MSKMKVLFENKDWAIIKGRFTVVAHRCANRKRFTQGAIPLITFRKIQCYKCFELCDEAVNTMYWMNQSK